MSGPGRTSAKVWHPPAKERGAVPVTAPPPLQRGAQHAARRPLSLPLLLSLPLRERKSKIFGATPAAAEHGGEDEDASTAGSECS